MARLKMQAAGWFCPTNNALLPLIAAKVRMEQSNPLILDPSCGDGRVVDYLAQAWGGLSYGNELNNDRYKIAKAKLMACTHGPQETLQVAGKFDVIYTNPPYDYSEDVRGERMELVHCRYAVDWLRGGGLFIALIPEHLVHGERWWKWWCGQFDKDVTQICRTPKEVYESDGKQVILFGLKRHNTNLYGHDYAVQYMLEKVENLAELTLEGQPIKVRNQTWNRKEVSTFRNAMPRGENVLAALEDYNPLATAEYNAMAVPPRSQTNFRPVIMPRPGHLAQLIAVGVLNFQGESYLLLF